MQAEEEGEEKAADSDSHPLYKTCLEEQGQVSFDDLIGLL